MASNQSQPANHSERESRTASWTPVNHRARALVIVLLRCEAMVLVGLALYLTVRGLTSELSAASALVAEIVFLLVGASGLYLASRGFHEYRSYGRAPAVLANLIVMGVAYYMISGGLMVLGFTFAFVGALTFITALFGYRD